MMITAEVIATHNLTQQEFERIKELLGREPSFAELGIFSVMWSEHCSYKSSRVHLKRLPTTGERVIVPPGENAGIVVAGEVAFDDAYALNPLVNAFALGLVRHDQSFFGNATGVGNPVLYVGAKRGRDGIHGATMASAEFDEEALEKRPTVQVGDPFLEKLLLEACLEAMRAGAVAGIQDMGAAGLTSSSCEMAARARTGIELDLSLVPQRDADMTAYEMLLS